jgi:hypothetical protein
MEYDNIVTKVKQTLAITGGLNLQANFETPFGLATTVILMKNEQAKRDAVEALRKVIYANNIDRYILSMIAWTTPIKGKHEKKEALIVIEFKKGDEGQYSIFPFNRDHNQIIFNNGDKSITTTKNLVSIWNVFLETDGVEEHLKNRLKNSQNINSGKHTPFKGRQ